MKNTRLPWVIAVLLLLLIIFLISLFFPQAGKKNAGSANPSFPESPGSVSRNSTGQPAEPSGTLALGASGNSASASGPASSANGATPAAQGSYSSSFTPRYAPVYQSYSFPQSNTSPSQTGGSAPATFVPTFTPPLITFPTIQPTQPASVLPPSYTSGTGPRVIGHARDGSNVVFNPQTGDLFVGEYHFNFAGANAIPGSTSNVVGDPDNLAVGTAIGTLVGSLLGNPGLGTGLGAAIGSNLISGHTLQDLGIGLDSGMLTLGGQDIVSSVLGSGLGNIGSSVLGSGLGSVAGGLGLGGNAYFGGRVVAMPCTCSKGDFYWVNINAAEPSMSGPYLFSPLSSTLYRNYVFAGTFNVVGSYTPGENICWMAGDPCFSLITRGKVNGSPGAGTSGI